VACLVGCLVERLLLRPIYTERLERAEEYAIIITFTLSLLLQNAALWSIGPYELTPTSFWEGSQHVIGDLYLAGDRLFAAAMATVLLAAVLYLIYRTWLGQALMATAQNRVGAAIVGINVIRMNIVAMGLSAMLAAAAGCLIAPIFLVYPDVGAVPVVKAFVVIVLGGMGSIPGTIIGALLLGLVESLGSVYLSVSYRDVYAFLVLMLVLLFRPYGLFGLRERRA
jgi:branched-chain amino acid transport system permease protein